MTPGGPGDRVGTRDRRGPVAHNRPSGRPRTPGPVRSSGPRGPRGPRSGSGARPTDPRRRLVALLVACCLLFTGVVARLATLQAVGSKRYVAFGESQRVRTIQLPGQRGSIFDRNGDDLALSVPQQTVWTDARVVTDPAGTAAKLAPLLGVDAAVLQRKLSSGKAFDYLARTVPDDVAAKVKAMNLPGIYFVQESKRFAPAGDLARGLLGSVDTDSKGIAGLELKYDQRLTGKTGEMIIERDPSGHTISTGEHRVKPAERGDDLMLTIDRSMQFETERVLSAQVDTTKAKGGIAIVMRPGTGEILASASVVAGENGQKAHPGSNNTAFTTVYEPGSVNKLITVSAAIEQGLVQPDTTLTVPDHLTIGGRPFSDHAPHPTAPWTVDRIVAESSNIGTIEIGQKLGASRLDEYLRRFGFGTRTSIGFPNESPGLLMAPSQWSGSAMGAIPIGQSIAVTAVQMLAAYNVIANGGRYIEPRLVLSTVDEKGEQHPVAVGPPRRVVSEDTARKMTSMLNDVVTDGTGKSAAIPGYTVAGKTGTARKPQPNGGYRDAAGHYRYIATFAGFVPAEDPQLSVIVVLDDPGTSIYASQVSAPVFAQVAQYGLRLFRIPPPAPAKLAATDPTREGPVRATAATVPSTTTTTRPR